MSASYSNGHDIVGFAGDGVDPGTSICAATLDADS